MDKKLYNIFFMIAYFFAFIFLIFSCSYQQNSKVNHNDEVNSTREFLNFEYPDSITKHYEIICDTIFKDNFPWFFFVSPSGELFFEKEGNKIFKLNNKTFEIFDTISIDLVFHTFIIYNGYFIGEMGDVIDFDIYIIDLKTNNLLKKIPKNELVGISEGSLLTKSTVENNYGQYTKWSLDNNFSVEKFAGYNNFILNGYQIYTFDAVFSKKKNKNELELEIIDTRTKFVKKKTINHNNENLILVFENYYLSSKNKVLFLKNNKNGKILESWPLVINKSFQGVIIDKELLLYSWLSDIEEGEEFSKYFFVCQKIKLPDFLKKLKNQD